MEGEYVDASEFEYAMNYYKEDQIIKHNIDSNEILGIVISRKKYEGICRKLGTYAVPDLKCNLYFIQPDKKLGCTTIMKDKSMNPTIISKEEAIEKIDNLEFKVDNAFKAKEFFKSL